MKPAVAHTATPLLTRLAAGLFATLVAVGCAPIQQGERKADNRPLVFPAPPDNPRFVYERTIYSSADVTTKKSDSELKQMLTGVGESAEGLGKPYAVAVHRGRVMVTDSADRFVRVFDVPAGKYYKLGEDEAGPLVKPLGIDVDNAGNVYVADATAKAIMVYEPAGKFLRKIGGPKFFDRLSSVTVDPEGKRIYVVDIGGVSSEQHRVRVFDAVSGSHLFDIGKRGKGQGEFNLPRDVALGSDGRIYVVDGGNFRVQIFDSAGKYLQAFGSIGKQLGNFARPKEVATDAAGNVYVVDAAFGNFQIFSGDGDLLMFVGERAERDGPARYMLPSGIYVDEDGRIYMVDQWFRKIDVYRPVAMAADSGFLGRRPAAARQ
jgi:DNA-binding beta-propeller fold protein YncE